MSKLQDIEKELSELVKLRDNLIRQVEEVNKELNKTLDAYYRESDEYVQVVCPQCGGLGYVVDKTTGKKRKCDPYIWMRVYKPEFAQSANKENP